MVQNTQAAGSAGLQPHGQCGRLALLRVWLFLHPCVLGGHKMAQSQGTFQRHSVILIIPLARTMGQHSAALGSFSGQNFCLLLMLSFS